MAGRPGRIVSLVPSLTEALFAFGVGQRVVGITRFCVEPASHVGNVPKVGGTKNVDVNAVLALKPDLVIANVEENTREDIERLVDAGANVLVTYPRTVLAAIDELHAPDSLALKTAAEASLTQPLNSAPRPGAQASESSVRSGTGHG
jgi:ABC-type hemin transport system substrate-binding protein